MRLRRLAGLAFVVAVAALTFGLAPAQNPTLRLDEKQRIETIERVRPAVVAIYARGGQGGGSGVLIANEGFALTNFHVVQGSGPVMQCGLADGVLYDAVLVGLDKVGDVALIKLLPKKEGTPVPFVPLGDSDKVKEGDWSIAMGNPFLLATDFTPTVTFGLISGVHRYQYPEGTLLEYTDCIQIDTSINPGNSGGPLFNIKGELIGINGRGSFDKRRRINSGVGYAISINQIKNFLGHLHAGLDTDHASLGARVQSASEDVARLEVQEVLEKSDAFRRGLDLGDELIAFAGRPMGTVNEFKNVLGVFPKDWRMPLDFRRKTDRKEVLVRLQGVMEKAADEDDPNKPKPGPGPAPAPPPIPDTPAKKLYVAKKGFANYHFNELHQKRVWESFVKHGDFRPDRGDWAIDGEMDLAASRTPFHVSISEQKVGDKDIHPIVKLIAGTDYSLDPLKQGLVDAERTTPSGSGGLLMAFHHYWVFLTQGLPGFGRNVAHGGHEPFYPYPVDGSKPARLRDLRVDTEVLRTETAGVPVKWYFSKTDQTLLGFEVFPENNADPCEMYLSDYRPVAGKLLPHRIEVRSGDNRFAVLTVKNYKLGSK